MDPEWSYDETWRRDHLNRGFAIQTNSDGERFAYIGTTYACLDCYLPDAALASLAAFAIGALPETERNAVLAAALTEAGCDVPGKLLPAPPTWDATVVGGPGTGVKIGGERWQRIGKGLFSWWSGDDRSDGEWVAQTLVPAPVLDAWHDWELARLAAAAQEQGGEQ